MGLRVVDLRWEAVCGHTLFTVRPLRIDCHPARPSPSARPSIRPSASRREITKAICHRRCEQMPAPCSVNGSFVYAAHCGGLAMVVAEWLRLPAAAAASVVNVSPTNQHFLWPRRMSACNSTFLSILPPISTHQSLQPSLHPPFPSSLLPFLPSCPRSLPVCMSNAARTGG